MIITGILCPECSAVGRAAGVQQNGASLEAADLQCSLKPGIVYRVQRFRRCAAVVITGAVS